MSKLNDFKVVKDYSNYLINKNGEIYSLLSKKFLKPYFNNKGYCLVRLFNNKQHNEFLVHRLVALNFIPNPNNYKEVNHIDFNKKNNNVDNLEWCSKEQNLKHSIVVGRMAKGFIAKKILQYDIYGNFIKEWDTITKASKFLGIDTSGICKCCKGKIKSRKGFIFKYKGEI